MTETFTDDDIDGAEPNPVREQREHIKTLEAQLEAAGRQNSVNRAVPNLSDKQIGALVSTHDGDWTPEAIKATAVELGFVQEAPAEPPADGPSPEDVAAAEAIANATSGAGAPTPTSGDEAVKNFRDRLYNQPTGSGDVNLSKLQAEFEQTLREAGGEVVAGTATIGEFVAQ